MTPNNRSDLPQAGLGILGGTGLYEMEGLEISEEVFLETPFGKPSDAYMVGVLEGKSVVFLSRHGRGHRILPYELNYRANIYGFKKLGVERIISISAVGSLKEELKPRDIVLADQFFDRTHRKSTFFGDGIAVHIGFDQPVCPELSETLYRAGKELKLPLHKGGTYICIEGPAFSTKSESKIYRQWGCDVIGMTSATEAKLSREAEICYATMSLVTDYDVWHESEEPVSAEIIFENLEQNRENAKSILKRTVQSLPEHPGKGCDCQRAVENCIVTRADLITEEVKEKLKCIVGKYL
ncbi:MAG: S-methyl-5'-thioadenosine phosphorylase [Candidatus Aminicenantes bacterium]|jgi:5'-methylthioadenosine phosphorylase